MVRPLSSFVERHPLVAIWFLAFGARLAYVVVRGPDPLGTVDGWEYDRLARRILAGGTMADPDIVGFVRPPLYPLFVAACYALGGIAVLQVAQLVTGAATAVMVALMAQYLARSRRSLLLGGIGAALYPWFFFFVGGLASETLYTFAAVGALLLCLVAADRGSMRWTLASGVAFGVAALARANILVCAPFVALWWLTSGGRRFVAAFSTGVIVALLPFTLYNAVLGNGFVLASSGGGLAFYIGNNPDASRYYSDEITPEEWRRLGAQSLIGVDAVAFLGCESSDLGTCQSSVPPADREAFFYRAGLRYIVAEPKHWAITEVRKLITQWRPWTDPRLLGPLEVAVSGISFAGVLLLAVGGLMRLPRTSSRFVLAIAMGATVMAVVWLPFHRYRFPLLDPVLIAAAAPTLEVLASKLGLFRLTRSPVDGSTVLNDATPT